MNKLIRNTLLALSIFVIGCEDNQEIYDEIDLVYNINLPVDDNGYYHLTINRNKWQTIHRFSGLVTDSNDKPLDVVRFEWTSNLYWVLGDTLGFWRG